MTIKALLLALAVAAAWPSYASGARLVMLEEGGCYWCERWDEEVGVAYGKTTEGKCAPLQRVDIHGTLPADLKSLQRGNYTPTFVLISNRGEEVGRIRGYPGEEFFYPLLSQLLKRLPTPCQSADTPKVN